MKKYIIISYLLFLSLATMASVPNYSEKLGGYLLNSEIYGGDTIGSVIIISIDSPILESDEKMAVILSKLLSDKFVME